MITLEKDRLIFRFPEVHSKAGCSIDLQRTLRIPDDGKDYPLPPGLGKFPMRHVDDYAGRLPGQWLKRGGVITPMFQAEAMWIRFHGDYPTAAKIATGKINAITGEPWSVQLNRDPQDYVIIPEQPWLDGYCVEEGVIRQFIAMPLGQGYSVEEQLSGEPEWGGIQILVYPMKAEHYEALCAEREETVSYSADSEVLSSIRHASPQPAMGLAPGGRMEQEVYDDPYGLDAWDQRHASRCFVTIANSTTWRAITGEYPPMRPLTAADYAKARLPWFDYYDADAKALPGSGLLRSLKTVVGMGKANSRHPLPENASADVEHVITLRKKHPSIVREATI